MPNTTIVNQCKPKLLEFQLPNFDGQDKKPFEFLKSAQNYFKEIDCSWSQAKLMIESKLTADALIWFKYITNKISSLQDFYDEFRRMYWSREGQVEYIITGKYKAHKKMSKMTYCLYWYNVNQNLECPLSDFQFIKHIASHYGTDISENFKINN